MRWQRLYKLLHQADVDHGGFVDDKRIALERIFGIELKGMFRGQIFQQAMQGLRFVAGGFRHALGGAAGGSGEMHG